MNGQKPKVLFILHLPPPVHGASMMGKYVHDSRFINGAFDCHYVNLATAKDLADIGKFGCRKAWDFAKLLLRIRRAVERWRPQLVYVTPNSCGAAFYKDFIVVQMLKGMGCKVVLHYHNKGVSTRQGRRLDNALYKRFFKGVKVILLAESLYPDIRKYVARQDVAICPNGIPDISPMPRRVPPREASAPLNILYLSNMMEEKGVWVLLEACKHLKERGIKFVCRFAGGWKDITEETFYGRAKGYGLGVSTPHHESPEAEIMALGGQYGEEKEKCFRNSNLFVFPTFYHNECFPLVLLEAMQHRLACISTREAGIPDIIEQGKTGLLVPRKDGRALADAVETLAADRELCRRMGLEGRKRYEERFTSEAFGKRLGQFLTDCIK